MHALKGDTLLIKGHNSVIFFGIPSKVKQVNHPSSLISLLSLNNVILIDNEIQ